MSARLLFNMTLQHSGTYDSLDMKTQGNARVGSSAAVPPPAELRVPWWSRQRYWGALTFNIASFLLPALYATLSKLWVARIDSSRVALTDVFVYISVITEVLNEGLPRAAWCTIGDASSRSLSQRLSMTHTLFVVQATLGLCLSVAIFAAADTFVKGFVPAEVRQHSVTYVRISAFSALSSTIDSAVATATRALDKPDVPLVLSIAKFAVNILLDMLLISTFHVGHHTPTVDAQAAIQLTCNLVSAILSLGYFLWIYTRPNLSRDAAPSWSSLKIMLRPGLVTFAESALRNGLYLWVVHSIVKLGNIYATAWGVFLTIRWGLIMIPAMSLEANTLTFVGHNWAQWRQELGIQVRNPTMSFTTFYHIAKPAVLSVALALAFETPICIFMSLYGARPFAKYLSENNEVAAIAVHMWRTIDWCYVMYAVYIQFAAVLLATRPKWYLWQSLGSNLLYVLPWAIVCQVVKLDRSNAWTFHAFNFGGSMVFSFFWVPMVLGGFAWSLLRGKANLEVFRS